MFRPQNEKRLLRMKTSTNAQKVHKSKGPIVYCRAGLSTRIFQAVAAMSHALLILLMK
jgi:hypothetical protein